jgi:hypothetical protein
MGENHNTLAKAIMETIHFACVPYFIVISVVRRE